MLFRSLVTTPTIAAKEPIEFNRGVRREGAKFCSARLSVVRDYG